MKIGTAIRLRRNALGLTLEQVALAAGTDAGNLSRVERGVQKASAELVEQVAVALGTNAATILGEAGGGKAVLVPESKSRSQVQASRLFLTLTPADQKLTIEFMKLLRRQSRT